MIVSQISWQRRQLDVMRLVFERDKLKLGELESAKPNAIIGDLSELKDILKETHGWTYEKL